jgi:ParB-like chromosome segregation protein Spo0J
MEIKMVKVDDLKPYENNPRFNDDAVKYVANSIKEFGFKVPMVIDKNNVIVTGHTRYKACLELGIKEVPCVVADDLTEEQINAFRLVDNKTSEFSLWNYELLSEELADFEDIDLNLYNLKEEKNSILDLLAEEGLNKVKEGEPEVFSISFVDDEKRIEVLKDYARDNGKAELNKLFFEVIKEGFKDEDN